MNNFPTCVVRHKVYAPIPPPIPLTTRRPDFLAGGEGVWFKPKATAFTRLGLPVPWHGRPGHRTVESGQVGGGSCRRVAEGCCKGGGVMGVVGAAHLNAGCDLRPQEAPVKSGLMRLQAMHARSCSWTACAMRTCWSGCGGWR